MNEKALRAGCASRGVEVSCKQHRSSAKESQATLCSLPKLILHSGIISRLSEALSAVKFVPDSWKTAFTSL